MKLFTAAVVLGLALGTVAFAEDAPSKAAQPFNWREVVGKSKDEAIKAIEAAGWNALVVVEDGKLLVTKQPKDEKPTLDILVSNGKVTGALLVKE